MKSVWMVGDGGERFTSLAGRVEADVAVVGGGITGTSVASQLCDAGLRVALVETDAIGARNTGHSTGNLYGTVSQGLATLRRKWSAAQVREAVALRLLAIDAIEQAVQRLRIDCGFARRPLSSCVAGKDEGQLSMLQDEFDAAADAGLQPGWADPAQLPVPVTRALQIEGQAQFNPFLYVRGLAATLPARGAQVFERSPVVDVDASEGLVRTAHGEIRARDIVLATHSPLGINLVQAEMEVFREYGISARLQSGALPQGICWVRDASRSIRGYRHGDAEYLVVVGEKHKTGEPEPGVDYVQRLHDYAREQFDVAGFEHDWSAQQFRSADGLPYIGRSAHDNVFIATGFGADGLTWGTVAAQLIGDLVQDHDARGAELLSPRRFTPVKSARTWASENATVARHLVGDRLGDAEAALLSQVPAGEGRIVELHGRKHAVHRAADGQLSVLSPVCPHMKCHVRWNGQAASWDCPCHGSRFDPQGRVLEGPATRPLEVVSLSE